MCITKRLLIGFCTSCVRACMHVCVRYTEIKILWFVTFIVFNDSKLSLSPPFSPSLLQRALNTCMRFIFNLRRAEHITPFYNKLRWLKVKVRRNYFVGCLLFNIVHSQQPSILYKAFTFRSEETCRSTRAATNLLSFLQCRPELFKRSFRFCASKLWNDLPPDFRDIRSIDVFKTKLYEHLQTIT